MDYRQFGRTDIKVSAIGFGCWEVGGTYGSIDAAQFEQAVHQALDCGVNCFDTAEAYGMGISEQVLGRTLGSRRREVCLVTKVGVGYPEAPNRRDSSRCGGAADPKAAAGFCPEGRLGIALSPARHNLSSRCDRHARRSECPGTDNCSHDGRQCGDTLRYRSARTGPRLTWPRSRPAAGLAE